MNSISEVQVCDATGALLTFKKPGTK